MPDNTSNNAQPLTARASELQRLAEKRAARRANAQLREQLNTRGDEVKILLDRARGLSQALQVYDSLDDVPPVPRDGLASVKQRVHALRERIEREGISILLRPKALDGLRVTEVMDDLERRVGAGWRHHVLGRVSTGGLEAVLSAYNNYKAVAGEIAKIRGELSDIASKAPTEGLVREVMTLQERLEERVEWAVKEEGLSERIIEFLRRAMKGVPLIELLGDPEVMAWVQDPSHAAAFQVRTT